MKFLKGMLIGGIVTTGVAMIVYDNTSKKRVVKKGKQFAKKMGII